MGTDSGAGTDLEAMTGATAQAAEVGMEVGVVTKVALVEGMEVVAMVAEEDSP